MYFTDTLRRFHHHYPHLPPVRVSGTEVQPSSRRTPMSDDSSGRFGEATLEPTPIPTEAPASILIVDDEAAQMQALCDALRATGFKTRGFTQPEAALRALANERFDVLLSDLNMPGFDGISLLREALK